MADINDLIAGGVHSPQVETLGDAFARMHAQQAQLALQRQALQEGAQRVTLGDMNIRQTQEAQAQDRAYRDTVIRNAGGAPQQLPLGPDDGQFQPPPATPATQPAPQAPPAAAPQAMPPAAPVAPLQAAPAQNQFDVADRTVADLRRQGLYKQADAMAAASLKQRLDIAAAAKDAAQGENDTASAEQKRNSIIYQGTSYLSELPNTAARAAAWPQVRDHLIAQGHMHADNATVDYPGDAWLEAEHGVAGTQADKDAAATAKRLSAMAVPQLEAERTKAAQAGRVLAGTTADGITANEAAVNKNRADEIAKLNTPAELAAIASDPAKTPQQRKTASDALKILEAHTIAGRPVNNNTTVNLTDAAKEMYADALNAGKPLPAFGRNGSAAISEISNLAASKGPVDMAANAAQFKADQTSLVNTQKTLDSLTGFESAAIKNLKLFTDAAAQIPDTGVPWLNTPVRLLDTKLVGSANMAAVNAARQIGLREIARITNDPKMSGQLTDTARKEVMDFAPANATLPQILKVAHLVQQDVANVHQSLEDQRNVIVTRMRQHSAPASAAPAAAATVKLRAPNGDIKEVAADQVDHYLTLGAKRVP